MRLSRSDLELEVLYNRIVRGDLDLQPDFQRGEVWDRARQARLIDTILRRWYIPPVHIVREEESQKEYVLDGQQRLRTILRFFNDEIRIAGDLPPMSEELEALSGLRFSQLPPEYQRRFQRFELTVVTLTDFLPAEPSELFFRLNQQYSLTPPEKRNALFGAARDQVKYIVARLIDAEALTHNKIGFTNGRLAYDDVVARFCLALQERTLKRQISNNYVEQFYRDGEFRPEVVDAAVSAGVTLGTALDVAGRVKFNKATLFSWLVFVHSRVASTVESLAEFLERFESVRLSGPGYSSPSIQALINAYSDRSSYRVLDIASVLVRNLVLHAAHAALLYPQNGDPELLELVDNISNKDEAEGLLLQFIEIKNWGASI